MWTLFTVHTWNIRTRALLKQKVHLLQQIFLTWARAHTKNMKHLLTYSAFRVSDTRLPIGLLYGSCCFTIPILGYFVFLRENQRRTKFEINIVIWVKPKCVRYCAISSLALLLHQSHFPFARCSNLIDIHIYSIRKRTKIIALRCLFLFNRILSDFALMLSGNHLVRWPSIFLDAVCVSSIMFSFCSSTNGHSESWEWNWDFVFIVRDDERCEGKKHWSLSAFHSNKYEMQWCEKEDYASVVRFRNHIEHWTMNMGFDWI